MKYILKKTIISISFIFLLALLIMCIYTLTYIKKTIFLRGLLLSYNIVGNNKQVGTRNCANKVVVSINWG